MPLVKIDKFAPSQRPYALHRETFRVDQHGCARVEAVWAGRKNGVTTTTVGSLWDYGPKTLVEFVDTIDMRYGGTWIAQWDGSALLTANPMIHTVQLQTIAALSQDLARFFPHRPRTSMAGITGRPDERRHFARRGA